MPVAEGIGGAGCCRGCGSPNSEMISFKIALGTPCGARPGLPDGAPNPVVTAFGSPKSVTSSSFSASGGTHGAVLVMILTIVGRTVVTT